MSGTSPRPPGRAVAVDPVIFGTSAAVLAAILVFSLAWQDVARHVFLGLQDAIVGSFGWLLGVSVTVFLVFSLWLGFSRYGSVRLGHDDEEAEFGRGTWLAMLFSAGMGIGLLFYGVAEPLTHYANPPDGAAVGPGTAGRAMDITLFHWGLHAWGIYVVTGLALAFAHHRRGRPLAIRFTLEPLLGRYTDRAPGKLIDVLAVFGTVFGLATSLGLGSAQINAGLARLFGLPQTVGTQVGLIAGITLCATVSVVTGLSRGIRRLSELNMIAAAGLLLFVIGAGPTAAVLADLPVHAATYLAALPGLSLDLDPWNNPDWMKSWTVFYWEWWISWAPFVGTFIARISRGRTVREFVVGVLGVPTVLTVLWFGVFGGAALHAEAAGGAGLVAAVDRNVATAIFALLDRFPLSAFSSTLAVAVVGIFFVTSSDSGSFVVDMLTSGGHPDPPVWQRIFWALTEGAVAAVLVVAGGLRALQSAAINTGLPFCLVLLAVCVALVLALRRDGRAPARPAPPGAEFS